MKKVTLKDLTLREKIGQTALMQMSWFMNKENLKDFLAENPIGNVWHNGNYNMNTANLQFVVGGKLRDSEYYRKWALTLRDMLKVPPFLGLDPISAGMATNIGSIVTAPTIGATDSVEIAYEFGRIHAKTAKSVGGNYLWGPVVDIPSRFNGVAIMRAMSDKPDKLVEMASAMIKGLQDEGVAGTAKHFPGCDDKEYRDNHFSPTFISYTIDEWREKQGSVFKRVIDNGAYSVMIGHNAFPAADDRKLGKNYVPATISYNIITKLLKEEMGFEGMAVTDAIDMASLNAAFPNTADLYIELLNAGNDLLLNVKSYEYIDIIEQAVKDGRVSEARIDDACGRVLRVKEKLGMFDEPEVVVYDEIKPEIQEFCRMASEKAITLECDIEGRLPLDASKIHNVAIISSTHAEKAFEALEGMKKAFEKRGMKVRLQRRLTSDAEIAEIDKENDLIIYAGHLAAHAPMGASSFYSEECETFYFAFTKGAEKSIGVSTGSVYVYYDFYTNANMFVHAYSLSEESMEAFVKAIFGEIPFEGKMPYIQPGPRIN